MTTSFDSRTDPLARFEEWFEEARQQSPSADVVALATASTVAIPAVRFVNYKGMHDGALTFYTNHESRKGDHLARNPMAAMVFYWAPLRRQVTVDGQCIRLPQALSAQYFATRDRETQLTAWASAQSRPLDSFEEFDHRIARLREDNAGKNVPCPSHWRVYLLTPEPIDFRVSGEYRRHRRWLYARSREVWTLQEIYP